MYDPDILNKMQNNDNNFGYDRDYEENKENKSRFISIKSSLLYHKHKKESSNVYNDRNSSPNPQQNIFGNSSTKQGTAQKPITKNTSLASNNTQRNDLKASNKNTILNRDSLSKQTLNTVGNF